MPGACSGTRATCRPVLQIASRGSLLAVVSSMARLAWLLPGRATSCDVKMMACFPGRALKRLEGVAAAKAAVIDELIAARPQADTCFSFATARPTARSVSKITRSDRSGGGGAATRDLVGKCTSFELSCSVNATGARRACRNELDPQRVEKCELVLRGRRPGGGVRIYRAKTCTTATSAPEVLGRHSGTRAGAPALRRPVARRRVRRSRSARSGSLRRTFLEIERIDEVAQRIRPANGDRSSRSST
jgi:hypothetical protein